MRALPSEILPWRLVAPPGSVAGATVSVQGRLEEAHTPTCINTALGYIYRNSPKKVKPPWASHSQTPRAARTRGWAGGEALKQEKRLKHPQELQLSLCCRLPGRALGLSWAGSGLPPTRYSIPPAPRSSPLHEASGGRSTVKVGVISKRVRQQKIIYVSSLFLFIIQHGDTEKLEKQSPSSTF